jgi:hypothetical protein
MESKNTPTANLIKLVEKTGNSLHWGVADMLRATAKEVESGERECTKALVLFLDDKNGEYNVGFTNAGMSMSECIALARIAESVILAMMEFE